MMTNKLIGYILITIGLLHFAGVNDLINITSESLLIVLLFILGLSGTFTSIGKGNRVTLFISTVAFLSAVYLYVTWHYVILNKSMIALPVVLFIGGAGLIMLFVDNTKEKVFLISGALLMLLSLLFVFVLNKGFVIGYANGIILYFLHFWPGLLIILGFLLLAGRYK